MKKHLFLILYSVSIMCYSQQNITFVDGRGAFQANSSNFITIYNDDTIDVEGSKYIQENYIPATISVYSGYKFNVRYNAYDDEMEVQGKENKSFALNKTEKNVEVTFLNTNTIYSIYSYNNSDGEADFGYFQKLTSGEKASLLKKEKIMFIQEKQSKTGYDAYRPPQFKRLKDKYYIKTKNNPKAIELPKNKKLIANLFPEVKTDILKFIKENKLKTNNKKDLIKLVNFINELN